MLRGISSGTPSDRGSEGFVPLEVRPGHPGLRAALARLPAGRREGQSTRGGLQGDNRRVDAKADVAGHRTGPEPGGEHEPRPVDDPRRNGVVDRNGDAGGRRVADPRDVEV